MEKNKLLYNVTVKVDHQIKDDWVLWMQETHVPDVMATACFLSVKLNKLLYLDDEVGVTYAIQYIAPHQEAFEDYQKNHAPRLQQEHIERYGDKAVAFRTIMEIIFEK